MLNLTYRYANSLLEFASDSDLDLFYRQAFRYVIQTSPKTPPPDPLGAFLHTTVPEEDWDEVVEKFMDLARNKVKFLETEIISAVPLTQQQFNDLEVRLVRMFRKQLDVVATVDPTLLGGLKVIVGDTVLDDSIKRKLADMKSSVYKGVYFKE